MSGNKNTQETLVIPEQYEMADLLGTRDCNLALLEERFPSTRFQVQEQGISVFGPQEQVDGIGEVVEAMIASLSANGFVSLSEIEMFVRQSAAGGVFSSTDEGVVLKYGNKQIKARTEGQLNYLRSMRQNDITVCASPAGSGKSLLAVCYSLSLLVNKEVDKIVITRPMVNAKGECDLGSLPGSVEDKLGIWVLPMTDIFSNVLGKAKLDEYVSNGKIQMLPLGYMRGLSLYNSVCIADEMQNTSVTLAKLLVTRLGERSKIIVCGDLMQQDSYGESGLEYLSNSLESVDGVGVVRLGAQDIVRHPLIPKMLGAFERYDCPDAKEDRPQEKVAPQLAYAV